jgi:hypothetical protein
MIVEVSLLKPAWDDIIVVKVDCGKMPPHIRSQVQKETLDRMKEIFPNNKILIHDIQIVVKVEKESKFLNF